MGERVGGGVASENERGCTCCSFGECRFAEGECLVLCIIVRAWLDRIDARMSCLGRDI